MLTGATVVFDLDGTMIDTAPDLIRAVNATMRANGMAEVATRIIQPAVGIGGRAMVAAALRPQGIEPDQAELDRLTEQFMDSYAANILVDSREFPGFSEALEGLQSAGALLAVCTNKRELLAKQLLEELRLAKRFQFIAGRDTFSKSKPDPLHLMETIRLAGGSASRAVMIGDSSADSLAAQAAGVHFIGVSFGYGESPIEMLNPDAVIHHFDELLPAVRRLLA
jgi:phosphoglycolate phosphatase